MNKDVLVMTIDSLPLAHEVDQVFPAVVYTGRVEVSNKGLLRGLIERNRNEQQEVYNQFVAALPSEANAVLGLQISTAAAEFSANVVLFVTYVGTPVHYRLVPA